MTEFLAVPLAVLHTSALYAPSASYFCSRGYTTYCVFPHVGMGTKMITKYLPADDVIFSSHIRKGKCWFWIVFPQGRECKFLRASPLAGAVE